MPCGSYQEPVCTSQKGAFPREFQEYGKRSARLTCITSLRSTPPVWCPTTIQQDLNFIVAIVVSPKSPLHTSACFPGHGLRLVLFLRSFGFLLFLLLSDSLYRAKNHSDKIYIYPSQNETTKPILTCQQPVDNGWEGKSKASLDISRDSQTSNFHQYVSPTPLLAMAPTFEVQSWVLNASGVAITTVKVGGILSLGPCLKITFLNIVLNKAG